MNKDFKLIGEAYKGVFEANNPSIRLSKPAGSGASDEFESSDANPSTVRIPQEQPNMFKDGKEPKDTPVKSSKHFNHLIREITKNPSLLKRAMFNFENADLINIKLNQTLTLDGERNNRFHITIDEFIRILTEIKRSHAF